MKISLVITVLNEERTIELFLDSVIKQTKLPDEIIICDAGSTDKTIREIREFRGFGDFGGIKIIKKIGNRARGRNEAIRKAKNEIVCVSDAGCVLDKKWVKEISKPFYARSFIDVVAGFYESTYKNIFEKCLSCYTTYDKMNENYLPSSRSIAFRKSAWQKVGGYPENLDYCEDLVFAKKLKTSGLKMEMAREAVVYWPQRKNLKEAFSQLSNYALGDFQASYVAHLKKIVLVYLRYILGIIGLICLIGQIGKLFAYLLICLFAYFVWAIAKNYRHVKDWRAIFWLPILQITADLAVMTGGLRWLIQKLR